MKKFRSLVVVAAVAAGVATVINKKNSEKESTNNSSRKEEEKEEEDSKLKIDARDSQFALDKTEGKQDDMSHLDIEVLKRLKAIEKEIHVSKNGDLSVEEETYAFENPDFVSENSEETYILPIELPKVQVSVPFVVEEDHSVFGEAFDDKRYDDLNLFNDELEEDVKAFIEEEPLEAISEQPMVNNEIEEERTEIKDVLEEDSPIILETMDEESAIFEERFNDDDALSSFEEEEIVNEVKESSTNNEIEEVSLFEDMSVNSLSETESFVVENETPALVESMMAEEFVIFEEELAENQYDIPNPFDETEVETSNAFFKEETPKNVEEDLVLSDEVQNEESNALEGFELLSENIEEEHNEDQNNISNPAIEEEEELINDFIKVKLNEINHSMSNDFRDVNEESLEMEAKLLEEPVESILQKEKALILGNEETIEILSENLVENNKMKEIIGNEDWAFLSKYIDEKEINPVVEQEVLTTKPSTSAEAMIEEYLEHSDDQYDIANSFEEAEVEVNDSVEEESLAVSSEELIENNEIKEEEFAGIESILEEQSPLVSESIIEEYVIVEETLSDSQYDIANPFEEAEVEMNDSVEIESLAVSGEELIENNEIKEEEFVGIESILEEQSPLISESIIEEYAIIEETLSGDGQYNIVNSFDETEEDINDSIEDHLLKPVYEELFVNGVDEDRFDMLEDFDYGELSKTSFEAERLFEEKTDSERLISDSKNDFWEIDDIYTKWESNDEFNVLETESFNEFERKDNMVENYGYSSGNDSSTRDSYVLDFEKNIKEIENDNFNVLDEFVMETNRSDNLLEEKEEYVLLDLGDDNDFELFEDFEFDPEIEKVSEAVAKLADFELHKKKNEVNFESNSYLDVDFEAEFLSSMKEEGFNEKFSDNRILLEKLNSFSSRVESFQQTIPVKKSNKEKKIEDIPLSFEDVRDEEIIEYHPLDGEESVEDFLEFDLFSEDRVSNRQMANNELQYLNKRRLETESNFKSFIPPKRVKRHRESREYNYEAFSAYGGLTPNYYGNRPHDSFYQTYPMNYNYMNQMQFMNPMGMYQNWNPYMQMYPTESFSNWDPYMQMSSDMGVTQDDMFTSEELDDLPESILSDSTLIEEELEEVRVKKKVLGTEIRKAKKSVDDGNVQKQMEEMINQRVTLALQEIEMRNQARAQEIQPVVQQEEKAVELTVPPIVIAPPVAIAPPQPISVFTNFEENTSSQPIMQEQEMFMRDQRYPFIEETVFQDLYQEVLESLQEYHDHETLNIQHQIFYFDPELQVKLIKESKASGYYCYIREDGILLEKVVVNNTQAMLEAVFDIANRVFSEYSLYKGVSIFPNNKLN